MIKVLGDLHFGVKRSNGLFHNILMDSLNWFLDSVKKTDSVVILGDVFDSRSSVDFQILNNAMNFFKDLSNKCKEIYILVGNHDLYYKENNLNNVNCRFLINCTPKKIHIVHDVTEIKIQDQSCLFIPWIDTKEKKDVAREFLSTTYDVVFGHMEGTYGGENEDTYLMLAPDDFKNNKTVLSGHFHKRNKTKIINFVGSFINQTFSDVGDIKGYHTINKNGDIKFVEGICPRFEYINVPNSLTFLNGYENMPEENRSKIKDMVSGNIIRLIVSEYNNENDRLYKLFKEMGPLDLSISHTRHVLDDSEEGEDSFEGFDANSDIIEIVLNYIENVKDKLPDGISVDAIDRIVREKFKEYKMQDA